MTGKVSLQYACIPKDLIYHFIDNCDICLLKRSQNLKAALKPIRSDDFLQRFQIDLIDMGHDPDGVYYLIAHVVDHWGKLHILWPQTQKTASEEIKGLRMYVFAYFVLPKILQR